MSVIAFTPSSPLLQQPRSDETTEPTEDEIRSALGRVLNSPQFSRSERLCRFLDFVVQERLAGRADDLKEYKVATEVYDRGPTFNPAIDTIVRVEARRLRTTLQAYYSGSGASDALYIAVPKGAYKPLFWRRSVARGISPSPVSISSVAVLPFRDLSGACASNGFCLGLSDEIVCALGQVEGLRVTASMRLPAASSNQEAQSSFEEALGAANVVWGSVRHASKRLRITAQLINAADGYHLWSQRFEGELDDTFEIQDEVATAVVKALSRQRQNLGEVAASEPTHS